MGCFTGWFRLVFHHMYVSIETTFLLVDLPPIIEQMDELRCFKRRNYVSYLGGEDTCWLVKTAWHGTYQLYVPTQKQSLFLGFS